MDATADPGEGTAVCLAVSRMYIIYASPALSTCHQLARRRVLGFPNYSSLFRHAFLMCYKVSEFTCSTFPSKVVSLANRSNKDSKQSAEVADHGADCAACGISTKRKSGATVSDGATVCFAVLCVSIL